MLRVLAGVKRVTSRDRRLVRWPRPPYRRAVGAEIDRRVHAHVA